MCKEKENPQQAERVSARAMVVKYWNRRERNVSEPFYNLGEAVRFMRDKEMQGYSTVLCEKRL